MLLQSAITLFVEHYPKRFQLDPRFIYGPLIIYIYIHIYFFRLYTTFVI